MATEGQTLAVDELVGSSVDQASPETTATPPRSRRWPLFAVLSLGFLAQAGWRLYLSWPLPGPVAHADEDGYLLAARVVGGGADAMLPGWSIMRPIGYPLLLSPIHWFVERPEDVYKGVHIVNAAIMALIFPLIYALARRLFDIRRWPAVAIAFVVATLPSAVFFSEFALTDAVLPTIVLTMLLGVHGMFASTRRAGLYGLLTGVTVGYAANTHVRGLVMLVVLAGIVALGLFRRWLSWPTVIVTTVATTITYLGGLFANRWLEDRMFTDGSFAVENRVFDRLTSLPGIVGVTVDAAGQIWHLCTSTWGLAGVGLAAAVSALVGRQGPRARRIVLGVALAMTVGIAGATATGIPYEAEQRINNHVYGRYVAILAAFWVLVGVASLLRANLRRAAALAVAAGGFAAVTIAGVAFYWGDWMRKGAYVNFDSPELSFLMNDWTRLQYFRVTGVVAGLLLLFALTLRAPSSARSHTPAHSRSRARSITRSPARARSGTRSRQVSVLAGVALVALLSLNLVSMVAITDNISKAWVQRDYHSGTPDLVRDAGVSPGDTVVQATSVSWMVVLRHQHEVYWEPLPSFDPTTGAPEGRPEWVVASTGTGKRTDWYGWDYGYHEVLRFKDGYAGVCVVWQRDAA